MAALRRLVMMAPLGLLMTSCGDDHSAARSSGSNRDRRHETVVPFESLPVDTAPPLPSGSPLRDTSLTLESVPTSVQAGRALDFDVAIENLSDQTIEFDPCPAYLVSFGESAMSVGPILSLLNCQEADPIPAGGTERFAMRLDIPDDFELDAGSIYWRIEPTIADASSGQIVVEPSG